MTSDEYAQILDDFELNAPGDVMPGESLTEYIERRRREFESKADGGSIGIEVLFTDKMKDGGRVGLFMGGPALEGQALNIYNSMNAYGFSDQEIANALQGQGLYTPPGSGAEPPTTIQPVGFQGGGGKDITELQKTYTTENISPTGGVMTQDLLTLDEKKGNPAFMGTVTNPEDYPYSGPVQQFSKIGENLYDVNPEGTIKGQRTYATPRTIGDQVYAASQAGQLGSISQEDLYKPSFFDKTKQTFGSLKDKFFQPKVKGTLGDRLLKQSQEGIMSKVPLPGSMFAKFRSPFNPESPTYNAALPMQLNFLEMGQVGDKSGLNLIGRNEGSGLLQYGVDSVLSGKNVISGFGTNDYETALRNFIANMRNNTKISKARKDARLDAAQKELDALMAKQAQEYIDSGKKAEVAALQKEIDSGKYSGGSDFAQSNQAAVGGGAKGKAANTDNSKSTGTSQGYSQHYAKGGLATMFTRRR
jgi:hypothetical protein